MEPLRNIHFQEPAETPEPTPEPEPRLRTRRVAVAPLEELGRRPGQVDPIGNDLAACILSRKGRAEVKPSGILIDRRDLGRRTYWHENSRVLNDLSFRTRKVFYLYNPHRPEVIHLVDDTGAYLETLPEKERPAALDVKALRKEAARCKTQINRAAKHLQRLHGKESHEQIERLRRNSELTSRIVRTMDAERAAEPDPQPAPSALGNRIRSIETGLDRERQLDEQAADFGRAVSAARSAGRDRTAPETIEDWRTSDPLPDHSEPETEKW